MDPVTGASAGSPHRPGAATSLETAITRWRGDTRQADSDFVAVEEPLEIRINGESLSVTMRTPGDDFALAAGLLLAEGIIHSGDEIGSMTYCTDPRHPERHNIVNVLLGREWDGEDRRWKRRFLSSSSCGLCGKATIDAVRTLAPPVPDGNFSVSVNAIHGMPDRMRSAQRTFDRTGGLHAAGLFDRQGNLLSLREDIGRHNAVDKLIGSETLVETIPLSERVLLVSGRTSFEILQKAAMAGVPVLCAVSAPSSLAVDMARDLNITLIGFLRGENMNIYAGECRVSWT